MRHGHCWHATATGIARCAAHYAPLSAEGRIEKIFGTETNNLDPSLTNTLDPSLPSVRVRVRGCFVVISSPSTWRLRAG